MPNMKRSNLLKATCGYSQINKQIKFAVWSIWNQIKLQLPEWGNESVRALNWVVSVSLYIIEMKLKSKVQVDDKRPRVP